LVRISLEQNGQPRPYFHTPAVEITYSEGEFTIAGGGRICDHVIDEMRDVNSYDQSSFEYSFDQIKSLLLKQAEGET